MSPVARDARTAADRSGMAMDINADRTDVADPVRPHLERKCRG
jgi:hypothetical protein